MFIYSYIKHKLEADRELKKLDKNYALVRERCFVARKQYTELISLIEEAIPKAPDARTGSILSRAKARIEICIQRIDQILDALKEHDCDRATTINEALNSMKELVNKDIEAITGMSVSSGAEKAGIC